MRFAQKKGARILPNPLEKEAVCPLCKSSVLAKCGSIKQWHWAHKSSEDCDSFAEGETDWHLDWKNNFPEDCQEVIIREHRADVKINDIVIEFQNRTISKEDIEKRESFYGKMKWVLNGETLAKNLLLFNHGDFFKFRWKWFPKSWAYSERPIYVDLSYLKTSLLLEIESYKQGKKHYSTHSEATYEWEDDYGNIKESEYPNYQTYSFEDTEKYVKNLERRYNDLLNKDLFLIRKLSSNGTGWGKLISKQNFIKECEYGYYRD